MPRDPILQPKGYQKLTGISSSTALTVPSGASKALLKAKTASVFWRDDGVAPTAADGMEIDTGDEFWYTGQLRQLRVISATGELHVSYYA